MTAAGALPRLQVGGTLGRNDLYVRRAEDEVAFDLLARHEFVSILTSRQMGKSSLMVRLSARLRAERGARVVNVDMAGDLGTPGDADGWYRGLLEMIAGRLRLEHDVDAWWRDLGRGTPNQRLFQFFREVVRPAIDAPIVIFLDEIDATLRLPYSDDLFTAIRSIYNQRSDSPELATLTFCLVGVAAPRELIKERRTTPYNIGQTVELRDFDAEVDDLSPLRDHLARDGADGAALLAAILRWTGGHPFLTTALTSSAIEHAARTPEDVDRLIEDVLRTNANDRIRGHLESISKFLATRLEHEVTTFRLYDRILRGRAVFDRLTNAHLELRLSGLVKRAPDGTLVVRNEIYRRRFGHAWLRQTVPMRSYARVVRVAAAVVLVATIGGALAVRAWLDRREGDDRRARADAALRRLAEARDDAAVALAFGNLCDLARGRELSPPELVRAGIGWAAYWDHTAGLTEGSAKAHALGSDAWFMLASLAAVQRGALPSSFRATYERMHVGWREVTLRGQNVGVNSIRFVGESRVASIGLDRTLRLYEIEPPAEIGSVLLDDIATALAVSRDGTTAFAALSGNALAEVALAKKTSAVDVGGGSHHPRAPTPLVLTKKKGVWQENDTIYALALNGDGALVSGGELGQLAVATTGDVPASLAPKLPPHRSSGSLQPIHDVSVMDKAHLITAAYDGVRIIDTERIRETLLRPLTGVQPEPALDITVSDTAARLAIVYQSNAVIVDGDPSVDPMRRWNVRPSTPILRPPGGGRWVAGDMSPEGDQLAVAEYVGSEHGRIVVYAPANGAVVEVVRLVVPPTRDLAYGPNGRFASAHADGTIRVWRRPNTGLSAAFDPKAFWTVMQQRLGLTTDEQRRILVGTPGPTPLGYTSDVCPADVIPRPPR